VDAGRGLIEQHVLAGERYELRMKSGSGTLVSEAIPGFQAPVEAFFDAKANTAALRELL
jgi:hypothetical protein